MEVNILYFAALREQLKVDSEKLRLDKDTCCVSDVIEALRRRGGIWDETLRPESSVRFAVDQEFANLSSEVQQDSEVAIFPPITGG